MPSSTETLLAVAASATGGGGLWHVLRFRASNRLADAESAKALATAYAALVDDLRRDNVSLREEVVQLRERIAVLEAKLDRALNLTEKL